MKDETRSEHASTYFVLDRSSSDDLARLQLLDRMLTQAMGGVLPEQPDPWRFSHVLDVGCGTGGWLIEMAKRYPSIPRLVGVDVSSLIVSSARQQAEAAGVSDRVSFQVMDALRMLEFPTGSFDLVNQRSGASYLRTWEWSKLLQEYRRVSRIGGTVRISEGEWAAETTSPALTRLFELLQQAFFHAGHSFTSERDGLTSQIERMLSRSGYQQVQRRVVRTEYRSETPEGQWFVEQMKLTFKLLSPFLHRWVRLPDDFEQWPGQAMQEMQQPDFLASGQLLTMWAITTPQTEAPF